jgi:hypothetical protein
MEFRFSIFTVMVLHPVMWQKHSTRLLHQAKAEKEYFQPQKNRDLFSSVIVHTFQNGYSGTVVDLRICLGKWNLPVETLSIPIQLFHGKMDKTVPVEFAENISRHLKNCMIRYFPEDTHLSLLPCHANEILSEIAGVRVSGTVS